MFLIAGTVLVGFLLSLVVAFLVICAPRAASSKMWGFAWWWAAGGRSSLVHHGGRSPGISDAEIRAEPIEGDER